MAVSDYFAELYVAGRFADAGWNVYFPHRDKGLDFVVSKTGRNGHQILRPVQVKGKYPAVGARNRATYGYIGRLNQIHPDMILAIPFFSAPSTGLPICTAYMPFDQLRPDAQGFKCRPASIADGHPEPRRDFQKFFDADGLRLIEATAEGL